MQPATAATVPTTPSTATATIISVAARRLVGGFVAVVAGACLGLGVAGAACEPKVPIVDIGAAFAIAEVTWFEEEQTMFVFFRVNAEQGLSDASQIELAFVTDDEDVAFAPLATFPSVHEHVAASCGRHTLCGSASLRVQEPPRNVRLRLRYHRDGALTLDAPVSFQQVLTGPAHTNRSAIVYGVFDGDNSSVQWRLRHQFPAIRNPQATVLGLRRRFSVDSVVHGDIGTGVLDVAPDNPYGYGLLGATCPAVFAPLALDSVETNERAIFAPATLGLEVAPSPLLCANSTVSDATGDVVITALAQKNPQVQPAVPELRSPIRQTTRIDFFFEVCAAETIDQDHRQMQLQRLLMNESDVHCVDDFRTDGFVLRLAALLQERIDQTRVDGDDMVLVVGLQRADRDGVLPALLEQALSLVVDEESQKSSPRLAGGFVFDSAAFTPSDALVSRHVVWCPSGFGGTDLEAINDGPERSCAVQIDSPIILGPLSVSSLPILPTRRQFRTFVDRFSVDQAGTMRTLTFRAPIRTPVSVDVPFAEFGIATFFNNEAITAEPTDSFSFCADDAAFSVVFMGPPEISEEPLPLAALTEVHATLPQARYPIGLAWDSPYLARFRYNAVAAGAVTVADVTVPFGLSSPAEVFEGSAVWLKESFDLRTVLLRCDRFCAHPTFDSAGVYNARSLFRDALRNQCYRPRFPARDDGGFPDDP